MFFVKGFLKKICGRGYPGFSTGGNPLFHRLGNDRGVGAGQKNAGIAANQTEETAESAAKCRNSPQTRQKSPPQTEKLQKNYKKISKRG